MFKSYPLFSRFLLFLIIPVFIIFIAIYNSYIIKPLPIVAGEIFIDGIDNIIEIDRDLKGVVSINASTDKDAFFSMGYVHAQDRLWQLEVQRRISQGRLSEIFGKASVQKDIWMRTLKISKSAKESIPHLSTKAIDSLQSYADGVNAWIKSTDKLPIEFSVFGIQPEPWRIEDSLAWNKVFSLNLSTSFNQELNFLVGSMYLSQEQLDTFFPGADTDILPEMVKKQTVEMSASLLALQKEIENEYKIGGKYVGSNAWVVSGQLTKDGNSILSNDPHLGLQIPSLWYAVHLKGKQLNSQGMSLVGLPLVVFGKNDQISWGGTNMMADIQDLTFEVVNPENPEQYKLNGEWQKFIVTKEKIAIRGDFPSNIRPELSDIEIIIRSTENGPIISDVYQGLEYPISLKWTGLIENDTTYEAMLNVNYASNWKEFNQALELFVTPTLNMLYADVNNNIGQVGVGKIPIRAKGNGMYPVLSTDSSRSWDGFIPFNEMPRYYNPENGYLINANNKIDNMDPPHFISNNFATSDRADRIKELLINKGKEGLTVEDMGVIQADTLDLSAFNLKNYLATFEGKTPKEAKIIAILKEWQGDASRDSIGATIYYVWYKHLMKLIFEDELNTFWNKQIHSAYLNGLTSNITANKLFSILKDNSEWCDNKKSDPVELCEDMVQLSLNATLDELTKLKGNDITQWNWGAIHNTSYSHMPFSNEKHLDEIFGRKISNGGNVNTVNVSSSYFDVDKGYVQQFGAGFRQIIEMSQGENNHLFMNSTGQSGQVGSQHYDDMVEDFRKVEYTSFNMQSNKISQLLLKPQALSSNQNVGGSE